MYIQMHIVTNILSVLSPITVVSLCSLAVLAEIFPFLSVSGKFLSDLPGFRVSSDNAFHLNLGLNIDKKYSSIIQENNTCLVDCKFDIRS